MLDVLDLPGGFAANEYPKRAQSFPGLAEDECAISNQHGVPGTSVQSDGSQIGSSSGTIDPAIFFSSEETDLSQFAPTGYGTGLSTESMPNASELDSWLSSNYLSEGIGQASGFSHFDISSSTLTDRGTTPLRAASLRMQNGPRKGLPRRKSKHFIQRPEAQARPVFVPTHISSTDPLKRWQESPPEDEPAPTSAIRDAVESSSGQHGDEVENGQLVDAFRTYRQPRSRAASTTSGESATSASSRQSSGSRLSNGSNDSREKRTDSRVHKRQSRGRKDRPSTKNNPRMFCCTFCCDRFKSKYDWTRHEKSLHLNLESWMCAPFGGAVIMPSTSRMHCAYCSQLDPTLEHLDGHNHGACDDQQRKFRRKDHLVQHLRHVHHIDTVPLIDDWKVESASFSSRCGFCGHQMASWTERCDHLAVHFRNGLTMADWKGDHGFPPSIIAQVTHAVPPYLIDLESRTMVPFSATNSQVKDHFSQMLSRATFQIDNASPSHHGQNSPNLPDSPDQLQVQESPLNSYTQVLTLHLSHFAHEQMRLGVVPTDEMFQREARRLLFDCDDPWNQTIADHPEWLAAFRENSGHFGAVAPAELTLPNFEATFDSL